MPTEDFEDDDFDLIRPVTWLSIDYYILADGTCSYCGSEADFSDDEPQCLNCEFHNDLVDDYLYE